MGPFLVAVLVSVCIALYVASEPISAKEWLLAGIPAWQQGWGRLGRRMWRGELLVFGALSKEQVADKHSWIYPNRNHRNR